VLTEDQPIAIELEIRNDIIVPAEKILASVVIDNLIDNAIRHAESGHIQVLLQDRRLVVSDSGKGIRESEVNQVFKRHHRGSDSDGAGIGLSLVKRICDLRGWQIAIDSKPGVGTVATLSFTPT
jgi:signal transduction histidine kinase